MLDDELPGLTRVFDVWVGHDPRFVILAGVRLRAGYSTPHTQLLIEIPADYPSSPPGIGNSRLYVPPTLTYRGRRLRALHPDVQPKFPTPGFGPWAWWCYNRIQWDPMRDNLATFVEMVRADLSCPHLCP